MNFTFSEVSPLGLYGTDTMLRRCLHFGSRRLWSACLLSFPIREAIQGTHPTEVSEAGLQMVACGGSHFT